MNKIMIIVIICVSLLAELFIVSTYNKYKKKKIKKDYTGFDIARMILDKYDLNNVYITEVKGTLTDHYYYSRKVIRLSKSIFHGKTIISTAMAAFFSAHALMDHEKNNIYKVRMTLEPIVNFITFVGLIFLGIGLFFAQKTLLTTGIIFELLYLVFQIAFISIEFDASKRALDELLDLSAINNKETDYVKNALFALSFINIASIFKSIKDAFLALYYFGRGD